MISVALERYETTSVLQLVQFATYHDVEHAEPDILQVRCSSQKSGCARCESLGCVCVYSTTTNDGRSKRRKRVGDITNSCERSPKGSATPSRDPPTAPIRDPNPLEHALSSISSISVGTVQSSLDPPMQTSQRDARASELDLITGLSNDHPLEHQERDHAIPCSAPLNSVKDTPSKLLGKRDDSPAPITAKNHAEALILLSSSSSLHWSEKEAHQLLSSSDKEPTMWTAGSRLSITTRTGPQTCECLGIKVGMLEEFSSQNMNGPVDKILEWHRSCVTRCKVALSCGDCLNKPESVLLLVLVFERLVDFCATMVEVCLERCGEHSLAAWTMSTGERVSVGQYQVDDEEEIGSVVMTLALFQAKSLGRQLLRLRIPASVMLRGSQMHKLLICERKMSALVEKLKARA